MQLPGIKTGTELSSFHVHIFDTPPTVYTTEIQHALTRKEYSVHIRNANQDLIFISLADKDAEAVRKAGAELAINVSSKKVTQLSMESSFSEKVNYDFLEGFLLALYDFDFYKKEDKKKFIPSEISLHTGFLNTSLLKELVSLTECVVMTRDWVNQPVSFLTAEKLADEFTVAGKKAGFTCQVLNKKEIESNKMGGLLAVNIGSPNPPTFSILEYKHANPINKKPIVLVGKGVVYDTGGLSLKPTEGSMDFMKCDMAGGAVVGGVISAAALNQLPLHIIGLVPATENRPSGNAFAPGDVITMFDGTTVEVLNTDAEGRLILADALAYAKKYDPELVIDLATLTGSAARAIGKNAAVMMGTAPNDQKEKLKQAGFDTFERLVEFPLWDDYSESIKSDIADLNNLGGPEAGAITAGKFLQHFTAYTWMHLDIAAPAFLKGTEGYRIKGGTGYGVRLLYHFLKNFS